MYYAVRNGDVVVNCHEQRAREVIKVGRIVGICDVGVEEYTCQTSAKSSMRCRDSATDEIRRVYKSSAAPLFVS